MSFSLSRSSLIRAGLACAAAAAPLAANPAAADTAAARPNIVLISADDLGWGDLGVFGQQMIQTPELDAMAAAGMRFTSAYAGSTVCTPSRASLLTGMHGGHARLRSNARESLQAEDITIGEVLQNVGYVTGAFGKWGVSGSASATDPGNPNVQGFEHFYGYLDNTEAKDYFPDQLWQTQPGSTALVRTTLSRTANGGKGEYGPDAVHDRAIQFIREQHDQPFFLYYASIAPHVATSTDDVIAIDPAYQSKSWPTAEKEHATKITDLDTKVGNLLDELAAQNLTQNTIVIFTADNGPHDEGHDVDFFNSNGPLRGFKRSMHDGGIRVPTIAWGPGLVSGGRVSDLPWAHWDLMATLAELADAPMAGGTDSVSLAETLLGHGDQADLFNDRPMFWRDEGDNNRGLRLGDLKAVGSVDSSGKVNTIKLYDLSTDIGESTNLAGDPTYAGAVQQMLSLINSMHGEVRVATPPPVPEPATALLLTAGAAAMLQRLR